ncbi:MAG TPA: ATP-grasp domain-containing protein [Myxococcota bacterium]
MHRALIQRRTGHCSPCHVAAQGFSELGYEIEWFDDIDLAARVIDRDQIVVGGVATVLGALRRLGIEKRFASMPAALQPFADRNIEVTTLAEARRRPMPFFMKPVADAKAFGGTLVRTTVDLVASAALSSSLTVLVSSPIDFRAEYRCFVVRGSVVGCRHYKGDPLAFPDARRITAMIAAWTTAPAAWALDVGVTTGGATVIVEVNDGHSTGDYGLPPLAYARYLEARWCELTGASPLP